MIISSWMIWKELAFLSILLPSTPILSNSASLILPNCLQIFHVVLHSLRRRSCQKYLAYRSSEIKSVSASAFHYSKVPGPLHGIAFKRRKDKERKTEQGIWVFTLCKCCILSNQRDIKHGFVFTELVVWLYRSNIFPEKLFQIQGSKLSRTNKGNTQILQRTLAELILVYSKKAVGKAFVKEVGLKLFFLEKVCVC